MHFSTFVASLAVMGTTGWASYVLEDDYMASDFFSEFSFFTGTDPTAGFVDYVDQSTAQSSGLVNGTTSNIYMGVDSSNVTPNGRPSVRLTSNKSYNYGLVILDLEHMPGGVCGTWPAFWMVGPNWPNEGEIDIIEGVNSQSTNDMTLHTGPGCSISSNGGMSGTISTSNCDVNAEGQAQNAGCQIDTTNTQSYGTGFNDNNGGVYATEWTSSGINIWFFGRNSIPSDISSGSPSPSSWGQPVAAFQGDCDFSSSFKDQQIVFDTTFCGDWAGNVWSSDSTCSAKASTCNDFVQNNPSAFQDAYWIVNSLKVYSNSGSSSSSNWSSPLSSTYSAVAESTSVAPQTTFATAQSTWTPAPTSSAAAASAPSSPPESATTAWTQETDEPWSFHEDGNGGWSYGPEAKKRMARHLRHHKRHGSGRL